MELSKIGRAVFEDRYALKDGKGKLLENDIDQSFRRVAKSIASSEKAKKKWENIFYKEMSAGKFCPGGRILSNSGTHFGMLYNCFVYPFENDSLEEIFKTNKLMALTQSQGGGTGYDFSQLRPAGSYVKGANGRSCGTIGFIDMMSVSSGVIEQGGSRRGANLGKCDIWHPDVWEFISFKTENNWNNIHKFAKIMDEDEFAVFKKKNQYKWQMYNVSVGITDKFLKAVDQDKDWKFEWEGEEWQLYTIKYTRKRDNKTSEFEHIAHDDATAMWKVKRYLPTPSEEDIFEITNKRKIKAKELWDRICHYAWSDGCPGLINISQAKKMHNGEYFNPIVSANPCLTGDTLVSTTEGLIHFDKLVEKIENKKSVVCVTDNKVSKKDGPRYSPSKVSKVFRRGKKECYRITLDNGFFIECTPDHKIFAKKKDEEESEWIEAKDLVKKNASIEICNQYFINENEKLPFSVSNSFVGKNKRLYETNLPSRWSSDLGFLLGWFTGDGWLSDNKVGLIFGKDDDEAKEKIIDILEKYQINYTKHIDSHSSTTFYIGSKLVIEFFKNFGIKKCKAKGKRIPSLLFQAPKKAIFGFLNGLVSSDGSVLNMPGSNYWIAVASTSEFLLNDLQQLLLMVGISHSSKYFIDRKSTFEYVNKEGKNIKYESHGYFDLRIFGLGIKTFADNINLTVRRKQGKLDEIKGKSFKKKSIIRKVKKVERIEDKEVYDITEDINNAFIASGITVSNCAEQLLPAYGVCCLASIVLPTFVKKDKNNKKYFDFEEFCNTVKIGVRFLDNTIDVSTFPDPRVEENAQKERRIGLGTIGIADVLIALKLRYDSDEGRELTDRILQALRNMSYIASTELAAEKGSFPAFVYSKFCRRGFFQTLPKHIKEKIKKNGMRNVCVNTQAPTGSTGTLLNCSQGCEPWFAMSFERETRFGKYIDGCREFLEWDEKHPNTPIPAYFQTASEIAPEDHIKMLALFSKYIDSSVSKTVNLPEEATEEDVSKIFTMAFKNGVKGITIFRDGCKEGVLKKLKENSKKKDSESYSEMKPKERDNRLNGATTKIMLNENMYVTVNRDKDNQINEVFVVKGQNSNETAWSLAIGKLISLALRAGLDLQEVIKVLKNIHSAESVFATIDGEKTEMIPSAPHAVARVLEEELKILSPKKEEEHVEELICSKCGSNKVMKVEGCPNCLDCGYYKCE